MYNFGPSPFDLGNYIFGDFIVLLHLYFYISKCLTFDFATFSLMLHVHVLNISFTKKTLVNIITCKQSIRPTIRGNYWVVSSMGI